MLADIYLTAEQLRAAAAWAERGDDFTRVSLRTISGGRVRVTQGDDETIIGAAADPVESADPETLRDVMRSIAGVALDPDASAADTCAALYEQLARVGVRV